MLDRFIVSVTHVGFGVDVGWRGLFIVYHRFGNVLSLSYKPSTD